MLRGHATIILVFGVAPIIYMVFGSENEDAKSVWQYWSPYHRLVPLGRMAGALGLSRMDCVPVSDLPSAVLQSRARG